MDWLCYEKYEQDRKDVDLHCPDGSNENIVYRDYAVIWVWEGFRHSEVYKINNLRLG